MSDLKGRAKEIFLNALNQTGDWESFIAGACNGDEALLQRVQALLKAHQEAGEFLPPSNLDATMDTGKVLPTPNVEGTIDSGGPVPVEMTRTQAAAEPKSSSQIGPYKLLEEIGEGGMGTVWVAQQSKPINRKVAIKLIKAGMDSQQVLARFEAERQALAMMDHPNIARVVDAGMTEQGRPYFAMEYVKGVPLTEYCNQAKLSVKDRLELFLPICNAVQHAHQKGIIHRDLKPSNILICLYDGKPVPKVIDFGLAKAMHQSLTDRTLHTSHGMMIGTPLYMSPEQAESNNLDIDTRTDIYSLGVILYELLTGSTPLEKAQFKQAAMNEILRLIKEVEAPKPSSRLSGSASLPSLAAQRSIDPAQLTRRVTGDLDWVVMKALEKERSRRYETANGLAADIRRHLSDEPVSASPPSAKYRMQKFVKRNRAGVITASLVGVALVLGVIGTSWGMWSAKVAAANEAEQREIAEQNEQKALKNEQIAHEATAETKRQLEQLKHVAETFAGMLEGITPDSQLPAGTSVYDLLQERAEEMAGQLGVDNVGDPLIAAQLQQIMAEALRGLGSHEKALQLLNDVLAIRQKELGENDPETLSTQYHLGSVYCMLGDNTTSLELLKKTLKQREQVLPEGHPDIARNLKGLGMFYYQTAEYEKAVPYLRRAIELIEEHGHGLLAASQCQHVLTGIYQNTGNEKLAMESAKKFLEMARKIPLPPENGRVLDNRTVIAAYQTFHGELNSGLAEMVKINEISKRRLGEKRYYSATENFGMLAMTYRMMGQLNEAIKIYEDGIGVLKDADASPSKLQRLQIDLARFRMYESRAAAEEACRFLQTMRNQHLEANADGSVLGASLQEVKCTDNLIEAYLLIGDHSKALAIVESICDELGLNLEAELDLKQWQYLDKLTYCYWGMGRFDEAIILNRKLLEFHRSTSPDMGIQEIDASWILGLRLLLREEYEEAEIFLRKVCNSGNRLMDPSLWSTYDAQSLLGGALLGQEEWKEAEPLLLEGFQGMKEREALMYWNSKGSLEKAAKRLVTLYKGMNNEAEAAKWQQTVDELHKKHSHLYILNSVESAKKLETQGKLDEEIAEIRKTIELNPEDANGHFDLSMILLIRIDSAETLAECGQVIALYDTLIDEKTSDARWLSNRAKAHAQLRNWDATKADWRRAIELDPTQLQKAVDFFAIKKQWRTAAEFGWQLIETDPTSVAWNRLRSIMFLADEQAVYIRFCNFVVEQPMDTPLSAGRAIKACLLRSGAVDIAKLPGDFLRNALTDGSTAGWHAPFAWGTLALLDYRSGDAEGAVRDIEEAELLNPDDFARVQHLPVLAMAQHKLGNSDAALAALDEASQLLARLNEDYDMSNMIQALTHAEILIREAEAKIGGKTDSADEAATPPEKSTTTPAEDQSNANSDQAESGEDR